MADLALSVLDVAGETIRIDVRVRSDSVELWSGLRRLGTFSSDPLVEWLDHPIDQLANNDVSWNSALGDVVLEIGVLFVSYSIAPQDVEFLKANISASKQPNRSPDKPTPEAEDAPE